MRTLIFSVAAIIVLGATIFIWSRTALTPSQATNAGTALTPATGALISPFDMMVNHREPLPKQSYDAH